VILLLVDADVAFLAMDPSEFFSHQYPIARLAVFAKLSVLIGNSEGYAGVDQGCG
jgi:hypothetical protein